MKIEKLILFLKGVQEENPELDILSVVVTEDGVDLSVVLK